MILKKRAKIEVKTVNEKGIHVIEKIGIEKPGTPEIEITEIGKQETGTTTTSKTFQTLKVTGIKKPAEERHTQLAEAPQPNESKPKKDQAHPKVTLREEEFKDQTHHKAKPKKVRNI